QSVTVAGHHPHVEVRVGELDAGRERGRAAVDRVEAVALDVVRKAARAADAADEHRLRRIGADLRQRALHGLEDRIVAAARAPADLLVALPVLERGLDGGHVVHSEFLADRSRNLSAPKALSATRQPVKAAQYTFSSLRAYTP